MEDFNHFLIDKFNQNIELPEMKLCKVERIIWRTISTLKITAPNKKIKSIVWNNFDLIKKAAKQCGLDKDFILVVTDDTFQRYCN